MTGQSQPVRMKIRTITALTKIAGMLQRDSGKKVSADRAAWETIKKAFPDIAAEVIVEHGDYSDDDDDDDDATL